MQVVLFQRHERAARHVDLADAQAIREPALDPVAAGGERHAAIDAVPLVDLRGDEALPVHEVIDPAGRLAWKVDPLVARDDVGQDQIAVAGQVVAEGGVLRAGGAVGRVGDGSIVGVGVGLEQRHLAVARPVGPAEQAARQVVREVAAADGVRLLRVLVRRAGGEDDHPLGVARALRFDGERGGLARPLAAGHRARSAGVEDDDPDVDRRRSDQPLERVDRQPRFAEAECAVLGVPRVIEEERGALAVAGRLGGLLFDPGQRRQHIAGAAVDDQVRVLAPHTAEPSEDVVDLAGVGAGIEQRAGVGAARVVAGDDGEPVQHVGARTGRRERRGEPDRDGEPMSNDTHRYGLAKLRVNCSPGRSSLGRRPRSPPARSYAARAAARAASTEIG